MVGFMVAETVLHLVNVEIEFVRLAAYRPCNFNLHLNFPACPLLSGRWVVTLGNVIGIAGNGCPLRNRRWWSGP